jgi:hypothetical protein
MNRRSKPSATIAKLLDELESFYGLQETSWPTDPYLFLVWWHYGYPASDNSCAKGWASLTNIADPGADPILLFTQCAFSGKNRGRPPVSK